MPYQQRADSPLRVQYVPSHPQELGEWGRWATWKMIDNSTAISEMQEDVDTIQADDLTKIRAELKQVIAELETRKKIIEAKSQSRQVFATFLLKTVLPYVLAIALMITWWKVTGQLPSLLDGLKLVAGK